jgi:hypothetical protein
MVWSRRPAVEDPKLRLDALPSDFVVAPIGAARFVVGPTGAYIVLAHDGTNERPRALGRLAATIRSVLAERMAWVPFVHPLLVDSRSITVPQATVVPPHMLVDVITEGRQTLEPETFDRIRALVDEGALDGLESVAPLADPPTPPIAEGS